MPGTSGRLSLDLIKCSAKRISAPATCTEADLRRATSDLDYALFHALCEELAQLVAEAPTDAGYRDSFTMLYRMPNHGPVVQRCRDAIGRSDMTTVQKEFAETLMTMKAKRDLADYDPFAVFNISEVGNDLMNVTRTLNRFLAEKEKERRRLALFLGLDVRRAR